MDNGEIISQKKTINPLIDSVTNAIETAKASRGKGATARLQAGEKLMASTKSSLTQLKKNLPASDIRYQTIADKLGLAILQCGIDYFNGSEAKDAAQKAMKLQSYAQSIVVGKMAKDRCKENVDILKKIIDSLPPQEVFTEANAVQDELRRANSLPDKTCHSITLLTNTKPHLQAIKIKLGSTNSFYLKLSTQVVNVALYNVIEEVNALQNDPTFKLNMIVDREVALSSLRTVLRIAWKATTIMDGFDMEVEFKSNRYNTNRQSLKNMCEQVGLSTTTYDGSRAPRIVPPTPDTVAPPTPPPSGKMPSWLAYLIGALLVGFIGALFNGGEGFVTGCILGLMFAGPILKAIFSED